MSHPNLATDEKIVEVGKGKSSLLGSCLAPSLFYLHLSKPLIFLLCPCVLLCRHWFVDSERAVLMCAQSLWSHPTLQPCGRQPTWLLRPWDSPGKNTGVGCHALLQGNFLTQGSNPHLQFLHCRQIFYRRATEEACKCIYLNIKGIILFILFFT